MARAPRVDIGGVPYHVINRANDRQQIFATPGDYRAFEDLLTEAKARISVNLYAYCIMPNHWHLVVSPMDDGGLSEFMGWLTLTHSKRWRTSHQSIGNGHLYQDRFRSFPIQTDEHFLMVARYVERNALRARLVTRAEHWRWSSAWRRAYATDDERRVLDRWPVSAAPDYLAWLNAPQALTELDAIRTSLRRGVPYGAHDWATATAERFGIMMAPRPRGRPRKNLEK